MAPNGRYAVKLAPEGDQQTVRTAARGGLRTCDDEALSPRYSHAKWYRWEAAYEHDSELSTGPVA